MMILTVILPGNLQDTLAEATALLTELESSDQMSDMETGEIESSTVHASGIESVEDSMEDSACTNTASSKATTEVTHTVTTTEVISTSHTITLDEMD